MGDLTTTAMTAVMSLALTGISCRREIHILKKSTVFFIVGLLVDRDRALRPLSV
jgi:hypothetical protein